MNRILLASALMVLGGAGCSTGRNLVPSDVYEVAPNKVYGGTMMALDSFYAAPRGSGAGMAAVWPMCAVDLFCSAFGDTFTLPYTAISMLYRWYNADDYVNMNRPAGLPPIAPHETIEWSPGTSQVGSMTSPKP